jgi:uncharacterized membrane protein
MGWLIAGLVLFFGVHVFSTLRGARAHVVEAMGEKPYKGAYALASLLGFVLIVVGMGKAPTTELWTPPEWGRYAAIWFMPVALISLTAFIIPGNLRRVTAHPMLWGVTLWALLHLLANGDLVGLLLFGSFGLYSVHAMSSQNARGVKAATRKWPIVNDIATVAVGLVLYWLLLRFHGKLFGVAVSYY